MRHALVLSALVAAFPGPAAAETKRIITTYVGNVTNTNATYNLKGTGDIAAIAAVWTNTDKFQTYAYFYRIPNVNYSDVNCFDMNFDYYLNPSKAGKWVVGGGLENQNTNMSAGDNIHPYASADMNEANLYYFMRAGRYFYYTKGPLSASILPFTGYFHEKDTGEIRATLSGYPSPIVQSLDTSSSSPLAGLNLGATIAGFIAFQANWMGRVGTEKPWNEYVLVTTVYLSRHWGLSYRYKYKQNGPSSSSYNLAAVSCIF